MKRFKVVALLFALLAVAVPLSGSAGGAVVESSVGGSSSRKYSPGPSYAFQTSGACAGLWQSTKSDECIHPDTVSSSSDPGEEDGVVVLDADYLLELATITATGSAGYCNEASTNKVRVIYAVIEGNSDRLWSLRSTLRDKAQNADYWLWKSARQQNGSRHFRYYCNGAGDISIAHEVVPNRASDSFEDMRDILRYRGYDKSDKKYLVFADWKVGGTDDGLCGEGALFPDDSPGQGNANNGGNMHAAVYLRAEWCDHKWGLSVMHELGHVMGAVQYSAPRHDWKNPRHPRDEHDVLAYGANTYVSTSCTDLTLEKRYDCNKNDYFDLHPAAGTYLSTNWNIVENRFMVGGGPL